jgi:hypothetical protein
LPAYNHAVGVAFKDGVDYAQLQKKYGATYDRGPQRKYSPGVCLGAEKMPMRRFTRLTNAFSKKIDGHCAALALYFFHYNFCPQHKSLRVSPAMAAGLTDELLSMESLCTIMDEANPPKKRGPYKKRAA